MWWKILIFPSEMKLNQIERRRASVNVEVVWKPPFVQAWNEFLEKIPKANFSKRELGKFSKIVFRIFNPFFIFSDQLTFFCLFSEDLSTQKSDFLRKSDLIVEIN